MFDLELDHTHVDRFRDDTEVVWIFLPRRKRQEDTDQSATFKLRKVKVENKTSFIFKSLVFVAPYFIVVHCSVDCPESGAKLFFR